MNKEELATLLTHRFEGKEIGESFGLPALAVDKEEFLNTARLLKEDETLGFNQLVCETVTDRTDYFELVCHLRAVEKGHEMILKTQVGREATPLLPSLYELWQAAELFEDEIYDLFGIRFENHPNLRRLFLDEEFEGYPLRKDFVNTPDL
ncbi:NADH-quinone oxidoreductase subunit C [Parabacteroides gordonii]|uniref:NADH-quinone oxidoreductase subunit C n=1 Tax=Parabacteroides gordonii TaxID=574930 RepID=UPI0026F0CC1C|nr:NADH-quinone oxidoreductase subunit C [Parabacteroides gordonii]